MDVLERLRSSYAGLSQAQRRVAEFLVDNAEEATYLNSVQLASRVGVAKATVIRLAQEVGFTGYSDLQNSLRRRARERLNLVDRLNRPRGRMDSPEAIVKSVIEHDQMNLGKLQSSTDLNALSAAVDTLKAARRVYVLGLRNSLSLAYFAWIAMSEIRTNVHLIRTGYEDWPEQISGSGSEDVLLAFSFRRYTRRSLELVDIIAKRGTKVIAFTDRRSSPLAQRASILFACPYSGSSFFESLVAPMSAVNVLLACMAHENQTSSMQSLEDLERTLDEATVLIDPGSRHES